MLTRTTPILTPDVEELVTKTIGCAIRVHEELGTGFTEGVYQDALCIELEATGLAFDRELTIRVKYRGQALRPQRLDLVVEGQIVLELKAVERLQKIHETQVISYLKASGMRIGLLMNFHSELLKHQLKRFVR